MSLAASLVVEMPAFASDEVELVSAEDLEREAAYRAQIGPDEQDPHEPVRRDPLPFIRLLTPADGAGGLVSPVRLVVEFGTSPDCRIVPESMRILYGLLRLDVTNRVLRQASIANNRLVLERATLPEGAHRFYVQIADSHQRENESRWLFSVTGRQAPVGPALDATRPVGR